MLALNGQVYIFYDEGYELKTESMSVDMKNRKIWTDSPVSCKGELGTLEAANGAVVRVEENVVVFKGPAKLVIIGGVSGF